MHLCKFEQRRISRIFNSSGTLAKQSRKHDSVTMQQTCLLNLFAVLLLLNSGCRAGLPEFYVGPAVCTACNTGRLRIHNHPGQQEQISKIKPFCKCRERAWVSGTTRAGDGSLWAMLPGWGSGSYSDAKGQRRQYGFASAEYLAIGAGPIPPHYVGPAVCSVSSGGHLHIRGGPGVGYAITKTAGGRDRTCANGIRVYVAGTVTGSDGKQWALLPGWGPYVHTDGKKYGLASAQYLIPDTKGGAPTTPSGRP